MRPGLRKRIGAKIGTVMTGRTSASCAGVVHGRCDSPAGIAAGIGMAGIALLGSGDVRYRLGQRIGKQVGAVVAAGTSSGCASVVHGSRAESDEVGVARIALPTGWNMVEGFA